MHNLAMSNSALMNPHVHCAISLRNFNLNLALLNPGVLNLPMSMLNYTIFTVVMLEVAGRV